MFDNLLISQRKKRENIFVFISISFWPYVSFDWV